VESPATVVTILSEGKVVLCANINELLRDIRSAIPFGPYVEAFSVGRAVAEPHFRAQMEWTIWPLQRRETITTSAAFRRTGQRAFRQRLSERQPFCVCRVKGAQAPGAQPIIVTELGEGAQVD
jgi:hypothetical protein